MIPSDHQSAIVHSHFSFQIFHHQFHSNQGWRCLITNSALSKAVMAL
jgi:hypothetical protein